MVKENENLTSRLGKMSRPQIVSHLTKRFDLTRFEDMVAEEECLNLEGVNGYDMCDIARTLIAEIKLLREIIDKREWTIKRLKEMIE